MESVRSLLEDVATGARTAEEVAPRIADRVHVTELRERRPPETFSAVADAHMTGRISDAEYNEICKAVTGAAG